MLNCGVREDFRPSASDQEETDDPRLPVDLGGGCFSMGRYFRREAHLARGHNISRDPCCAHSHTIVSGFPDRAVWRRKQSDLTLLSGSNYRTRNQYHNGIKTTFTEAETGQHQLRGSNGSNPWVFAMALDRIWS